MKPARPLRGKTDTELHYILSDAAKAAEAMRGHSPEAEAKYLDQMNDTSTELGYRRGRRDPSGVVARLIRRSR